MSNVRHPKDTPVELQVVLNTFASDVFRRQADFDYIAARANYKMQLRQQFLWSSQQAIEKYLKAILLFNGRSARYPEGSQTEMGHKLTVLVKEVEKISIFTFNLDPQYKDFLKYLSEQGTNRYLITIAYNTRDVLHQLDGTVWQLRRYCQYFPDRVHGSPGPIQGMREESVNAALNPNHKKQPQLFRVFGGELEKIVNRAKTDPARQALVWANLNYGAKRRTTVTLRTFSSSEIPPAERGWTGVDWDDIKKYVKL